MNNKMKAAAREMWMQHFFFMHSYHFFWQQKKQTKHEINKQKKKQPMQQKQKKQNKYDFGATLRPVTYLLILRMGAIVQTFIGGVEAVRNVGALTPACVCVCTKPAPGYSINNFFRSATSTLQFWRFTPWRSSSICEIILACQPYTSGYIYGMFFGA